MYLFIINKKEIQKKRNIKSRKIDKRKRKILVLMHIITERVSRYLKRKCIERFEVVKFGV